MGRWVRWRDAPGASLPRSCASRCFRARVDSGVRAATARQDRSRRRLAATSFPRSSELSASAMSARRWILSTHSRKTCLPIAREGNRALRVAVRPRAAKRAPRGGRSERDIAAERAIAAALRSRSDDVAAAYTRASGRNVTVGNGCGAFGSFENAARMRPEQPPRPRRAMGRCRFRVRARPRRTQATLASRAAASVRRLARGAVERCDRDRWRPASPGAGRRSVPPPAPSPRPLAQPAPTVRQDCLLLYLTIYILKHILR